MTIVNVPGGVSPTEPVCPPLSCPDTDCEGFVPNNNTAPQVRVYRSPVAGARLYISKHKFRSLEPTGGWITFAAAGNPMPHPHNYDILAYPYGEFCTGDSNLAAYLDALALSNDAAVMFAPVENPVPV